jgi:hypothetical protein
MVRTDTTTRFGEGKQFVQQLFPSHAAEEQILPGGYLSQEIYVEFTYKTAVFLHNDEAA